MPLTDLPLAELERYRPEVLEPADFDAFWEATLAASRQAGGTVELRPADTPITELVVEDLTFPGFAGEPVKGWVTRPRGRDGERLPAVVEYNGYGGGRGIPGERVSWALAGYVHVFMDTRGQGSRWGTGGETPDPHGSTPAIPGYMTRGILDPHDYYYRRLFTDAALLVDVAAELPAVDPLRIAVAGGSQGGGVAIAAAALSPRVRALLPDVAFLCDFRRGIEVTLSDPYQEISGYLAVHRDHVGRVLETVSYFDGANFATRIDSASALFSVGLMDEVVPPSTTFAAYNRLATADKEMAVYPFNGHEGGQAFHWLRQVEFLRTRFA